ncbi:MAG: chemotaxis protein CheD [Planctomycetota bacterium]|nr:chemotaxis protein CheD [Planctomycetota bacterium]
MSKIAENEGLVVKMAEIGVLQHVGILRTLLGSCVGVALFERKLKLSGLAHIVLPFSVGRDQSLGKYVDTAIPETIRQMTTLARGAKLSLTAKIAGGANMFSHVSPNNLNAIGEQNIVAVEKVLADCQIPIVARHLGGTFGRRMVVDVESGLVQIHVVGQTVVQF